MNDVDALLTRSFAEAHEPADDGFSVQVGDAVARREKLALGLSIAQSVGLVAAIGACAWGLMALVGIYSDAILDSFGLSVANGRILLTRASSINFASVAAGATQFLLIAGGVIGAGVVYRNTQQQ